MASLTLPRQHLTQMLNALLPHPHLQGLGPAGRNVTRLGTDFLAQALRPVPATTPVATLPEDQLRLRLARTSAALHDDAWLIAPEPTSGHPGRTIIHLTLGVEDLRGQWSGTVVEAGLRPEPLQALRLVGAEMATLIPGQTETVPPTDHTGPWSRTRGALGAPDVWPRLTALHACLIGVSRTGSLLATSLARLGVQHLTLLDPDVVEAHHLDSMDGVTPADVGRAKVTAVATSLHTLAPALRLTALPQRLTEPAALVRVKEADVLLCCVDNDAARLLATTLATLYLKPLIDVGTGIVFTPDAQRQMGADVRCVLPGEACLLCAGGLVQEAEARRTLATWSPVRAATSPVPWQTQRAGSLRTLNHLAAHLGLQMWLDLVAGRLATSCWAQVEFDAQGRLQVRYPPLPPVATTACVLCRKAGVGDAGLGWLAL